MSRNAGMVKLMDNDELMGPINIGNPTEFTMLELAKVPQAAHFFRFLCAPSQSQPSRLHESAVLLQESAVMACSAALASLHNATRAFHPYSRNQLDAAFWCCNVFIIAAAGSSGGREPGCEDRVPGEHSGRPQPPEA